MKLQSQFSWATFDGGSICDKGLAWPALTGQITVVGLEMPYLLVSIGIRWCESLLMGASIALRISELLSPSSSLASLANAIKLHNLMHVCQITVWIVSYLEIGV